MSCKRLVARRSHGKSDSLAFDVTRCSEAFCPNVSRSAMPHMTTTNYGRDTSVPGGYLVEFIDG